MRHAPLAFVAALFLPAQVPHAVTLHIESFGERSAVIHVAMYETTVRPLRDSAARDQRPVVLHTPVRLEIDARVQEVSIETDADRSVRLTFETGASANERALRAWGRRIVLRRSVDGDLVPQLRAYPLLSAH